MIKYNLCFLNVTSRFASNLDQNITEADFDCESDGGLKNELADLNEQLRQERMNHQLTNREVDLLKIQVDHANEQLIQERKSHQLTREKLLKIFNSLMELTESTRNYLVFAYDYYLIELSLLFCIPLIMRC